MTATVLLISGTADVRRQAAAACEAVDAKLVSVEAIETPVDETPDVVICDYEAFDDVCELFVRPCVLLVGDGSDSERAIDAIKRGAIDYLALPATADAMRARLEQALRVSRDSRTPVEYDEPSRAPENVYRIIGQSPAMQDMYKAIGLIAPRDINVLITGESGTGKELVARALLQHSPRREQTFVAVNCAAIPETLLESELFGHEKGAFTGADQRRIGRFEQCSGGTLFLDEIGDIPIATQAKLLRVLQDQSFQRLGGSTTITADVRILAATHQPLERLIAERKFRQDLFYRLNVASVHVPALREREVDAVLLAHYFVERYNRDFKTEIRAFAPETLRVLLQYDWPGNVRELENAIKAALVMARGSVLRPEFLPESIRTTASDAAPVENDDVEARQATFSADMLRTWAEQLLDKAEEGQVYAAAVAAVESRLLRAALNRHSGRAAPAARQLGISRTTLRKKIADHGISITTD